VCVCACVRMCVCVRVFVIVCVCVGALRKGTRMRPFRHLCSERVFYRSTRMRSLSLSLSLTHTQIISHLTRTHTTSRVTRITITLANSHLTRTHAQHRTSPASPSTSQSSYNHAQCKEALLKAVHTPKVPIETVTLIDDLGERVPCVYEAFEEHEKDVATARVCSFFTICSHNIVFWRACAHVFRFYPLSHRLFLVFAFLPSDPVIS